ncbi:unnamed protein product [Vitrella brassicaformis CCMP3155]|uniref:C-type lectin domain-containing protein n=2 Tax=Vitrella brassicaformis TaxID=1169539 RepID=A0A0G4GBV8_VITBC|nr:unnamed protein product [Vitrella brassicaformis CCMP3155]|eukprot:CEM26588.1 unnamed protein product [Vitrella brassicaformis CCMP3155]
MGEDSPPERNLGFGLKKHMLTATATKETSDRVVPPFFSARRMETPNMTRARYEIQHEYDDYFNHQKKCRARGGKLAEPSSVADLEAMFNATRDFGGSMKNMIFLIGIVMRQECHPATQRFEHSCWTFASKPKGGDAPWFFGTSYWPEPRKQPDNFRHEGQNCTYYVSSIWPGARGFNTPLEPLLPHGTIGDEVCTHDFRALCEFPTANATETAER